MIGNIGYSDFFLGITLLRKFQQYTTEENTTTKTTTTTTITTTTTTTEFTIAASSKQQQQQSCRVSILVLALPATRSSLHRSYGCYESTRDSQLIDDLFVLIMPTIGLLGMFTSNTCSLPSILLFYYFLLVVSPRLDKKVAYTF